MWKDFDYFPKSIALPPKCIERRSKGQFDITNCRRCGREITETHYNYCPNCGGALLHNETGGFCTWRIEQAEEKYQEIKENWVAREKERTDFNVRHEMLTDVEILIERLADNIPDYIEHEEFYNAIFDELLANYKVFYDSEKKQENT